MDESLKALLPLRSYPVFAEQMLKVRHKTDLKMVPLVPTTAQRHFREKRGRKMIVLKARQQGISTDTMGMNFHGTIFSRNTNALTVAHEASVSEELLMKVKLFYENLPEGFRPEIKYDNRWEMYFPALNSSFRIGTAGGRGVGVGRTIDRLHCSEFAKWEDDRETFLKMLASVPPAGEIIIESTADGVGNEFHRMWQAAEQGKSDFIPVFLPWMSDPAYRYALGDGEDIDEMFPVDRDMREYEAKFNLTPEQKKWHRLTRRQFGDLFDQEYPASPELAFIGSRRCFFSLSAIRDYQRHVEKPTVGRMTGGGFVEDKDGFVSVWKKPEKDRPYVIFADVAEGLEHGDYSAAYVYSPWDRDFVAGWHGHLDPDLFADELAMLGRYFSGSDGRPALIGVESNNHGFTVLNSLKRRIRYPRIYYKRGFNKRTKTETEELGWRTDMSTKRFMLDLLAGDVRDGLVGVPDGALLDEMLCFLRDEFGRGGAEAPNHDDRVMAAAGCLVIAQEIPSKPREKVAPEPFKPGDGMKAVEKQWRKWDEDRQAGRNMIGHNWQL